MRISVVIPTKNRFNNLVGVIRSLLAQSIRPNEIIIVDDSDGEVYHKSKKYLRNLKIENNEIKIFHLKGTGEGVNSARNLGVDKATGDIVLFLDDDVILGKDYIKAILEVYLRYPHVGGVGGVIQNYPKTNIVDRFFTRIFFLSNWADNKAYLLPSGFPCHLRYCNRVTEVEILSGCNMSFKSNIFKEFGFDENLKGYSYLDDVDFSYRVSRKYRLLITPKARVIHKTTPKSSSEGYYELKVYYHYLIFRKLVNKNMKSITAFYISLLGNLIQAIIASLIVRKKCPINGFLKGLYKIIKSPNLNQFK
ncbi:MAG: glycosyltransferase family 2 protein [Candidatus Baldrarchaeia archaeon]